VVSSRQHSLASGMDNIMLWLDLEADNFEFVLWDLGLIWDQRNPNKHPFYGFLDSY